MKKWFVFPSENFNSPSNDFWIMMSWELITVVAESNSWKTTFAMDTIAKNSKLGRKCFYINLEFAIETMRKSRWLWLNKKKKENLTDLNPLTEEEEKEMNKYVEENLKKFDYYNNANWLSLDKLVNIISEKALEWYEFFVIDTFSRIEWNLNSQIARTSQNKCMETLQEMAQRLDIAIMVLHHTNRAWTFEGSQKIMDLSNMFILIEKDVDWEWEEYRRYKLMKDKYTTNQEVELYYHGWKYEF